MNRIKFLRPGLYTSIQDMKRIGYKKYGIPNSGPMDEYSHILANWLVDRKYSSETLEINYFGPKIKFNFNTTIGICGANFDAKINNKRIQINRSIKVKAGDVLDIGICLNGGRVYLSFSAKMKLKKSFNSYSTYEKINIGGINGKKISKNDTINFNKSEESIEKKIHESFQRKYQEISNIRVIKGVNYSMISKNSSEKLSNEFNVSSESDRMGIRLNGNKLKVSDKKSIESTVVSKGTVQLPPAGDPIILMSDSQSTGGYPIIGNIARVDISKVSQIKPESKLKFKFITLEESESLINFEKRKFKSQLGIDLSS
ncbi:MAG: biotin-dependent carboxyltransferase family protein [Cytophagales bacterium]|nr:biotin-dependent carboxyltransferase family protein [Cytophagales bacterium]